MYIVMLFITVPFLTSAHLPLLHIMGCVMLCVANIRVNFCGKWIMNILLVVLCSVSAQNKATSSYPARSCEQFGRFVATFGKCFMSVENRHLM